MQHQSPLCPITQQPLSLSDPLDIAVVYNTAVPFVAGVNPGCGHRCSLLPLVRYLQGDDDQDSPAGGKKKARARPPPVHLCPSCGKSPIISLCDEVSASILLGGGGGVGETDSALPRKDVVGFRYGKHNFRLAVGGTEANAYAQDRIANVLGLRVEGDLKILHNGKVIYPNSKASPEEISIHILGISRDDICKKKKPSLVVMGARAGHFGTHAGHYRK